MTTIQVRTQHLLWPQALKELQECHKAVREISDACAVTIASWWQSPGLPGNVLAQFASGAETDLETLRIDLSLTIKDEYDQVSEIDKLSLDMLGTYLIAKINGSESEGVRA